jgi:hypothetical protein
VDQVVEEPMEVPAERIHGLAAHPQARVTKGEDREDAHAGRV